jgi:hypothetical protein
MNLQHGPKSHIGDEILGNCESISPQQSILGYLNASLLGVELYYRIIGDVLTPPSTKLST